MQIVLIALSLLFLAASCAEKRLDDVSDKIATTKSEQLLNSKNITKSNDDNQKPSEGVVPNVLTLNLAGNLVDVKVDDSRIAIVALPKLIKMPLTLRTLARFESVPNIKALKSTCDNMEYRVNKHQAVTAIKARALLNPFSRIAVNAAVSNKGIALTTNDVEGSFQATSWSVEEIDAAFFTEEELGRLKNWLSKQYEVENTYLDFTIFRRMDDFNSTEPIGELGRLICGILEGEAHLDFALTDKNGRRFTVRINTVQFSND
jgi:hypothetical protein